jgi:hypothetical protein
VHKTETISANLNPVWKPFVIDLDKLCNGDLDAEFKLECWDEVRSSSCVFPQRIEGEGWTMFVEEAAVIFGRARFRWPNGKKTDARGSGILPLPFSNWPLYNTQTNTCGRSQDKMSSHDMIGWTNTSVNALLSKAPITLNDRPGGKTAQPGSVQATGKHPIFKCPVLT